MTNPNPTAISISYSNPDLTPDPTPGPNPNLDPNPNPNPNPNGRVKEVCIEVRNPAALSWLINQREKRCVEFIAVPGPMSIEESEESHTDDLHLGHGKKRTLTPEDAQQTLEEDGFDNLNGASKRARIRVKQTQTHSSLKEIGSYRVKNGMIQKKRQPVTVMQDSSEFVATLDTRALWERFDQDGFVFLKGLIKSGTISKAREAIEGVLRDTGATDEEGKPTVKHGWTIETESGSMIAGSASYAGETEEFIQSKWREVGKGTELKAVVWSDAVRAVLKLLAKGRTLAARHANGQRSMLMSEAEHALERTNVHYESRMFDPNYTWLRVKNTGEQTPEHGDIFYYKFNTDMFETPFPRLQQGSLCICQVCGTEALASQLVRCAECAETTAHPTCVGVVDKRNWFCSDCQPRHVLGTVWIPLGEVSYEEGPLCLLGQSQHMKNYMRPFKDSQMPASYYAQAGGVGLVWYTQHFHEGDVVIFDSRTIHATAKNYSNKFRLSLDFRWTMTPDRPNFGSTHTSRFLLDTSRPVSVE